jgi:hypothetical protein
MPASLVASTLAPFRMAIAFLAAQPAAPLAARHVAFAAGGMPLVFDAIACFMPALARLAWAGKIPGDEPRFRVRLGRRFFGRNRSPKPSHRGSWA